MPEMFNFTITNLKFYGGGLTHYNQMSQIKLPIVINDSQQYLKP